MTDWTREQIAERLGWKLLNRSRYIEGVAVQDEVWVPSAICDDREYVALPDWYNDDHAMVRYIWPALRNGWSLQENWGRFRVAWRQADGRDFHDNPCAASIAALMETADG